MKRAEALFVLSQAQQDRRIDATMEHCHSGGNPLVRKDQGYRVRLVLMYRERILVARNVREWHDIKSIWSDL